MNLSWLTRLIAAVLDAVADAGDDAERSLMDGSEMIGDLNFRTGRMDCGLDYAGYYEDDL